MPRDRQQQQSAADFKKKRAADLRKKKRQARKFKAVATENYDIASSMASAKINIQSMKAAGESVESFARQLARDSNNAAIQNSIDFNTAQKKEALEAARNEASAAGAAALIARQNADNFRADAAGKEIESVTRTAAALQNGVAFGLWLTDHLQVAEKNGLPKLLFGKLTPGSRTRHTRSQRHRNFKTCLN